MYIIIIIVIVIGLLVAIGSRGSVARNEEEEYEKYGKLFANILKESIGGGGNVARNEAEDEKYIKLLDQSLKEMQDPKTLYSSASFDDDGVIGKAVWQLAQWHSLYGDGLHGLFSPNQKIVYYKCRVRDTMFDKMEKQGRPDNIISSTKSQLALFLRVCVEYPECSNFQIRILQLGNALFQQGELSRQELESYYNKRRRLSHTMPYKMYKQEFDAMST